MASTSSQIATAAPQVDMDQFAQLMEQQLQTGDASKAQDQLKEIFEEFGQNLGGKTLSEVATAEGFNAEKAMELIPASIINNAAEASGESKENVLADFTKIMGSILHIKDAFLSLVQPAPEDAAEPEEFRRVRRVQTMKDGENVETMEFNPPNVEEITKLVKAMGLGESGQEGDSNVNLEQIFKNQASAFANSSRTAVPIAHPKEANAAFAKYRKHVNTFIEAMDNSDATPETFGAAMATLTAYPLSFEARLTDTQAEVKPIVANIREVLMEMQHIVAVRNKPVVGLILKTIVPAGQIDEMEEGVLGSKDLKEKWDEIESAVTEVIEAYNEDEAEAEDKEAEERANDLD